MSQTALKTFIIYARDDKAYKDDLIRHLQPLVGAKMLELWHDGDINPGEEWEIAIKKNLKSSQIILVLVSAHCLDSDFIQTDELEMALLQMKAGSARIIPIIVSPCGWQYLPIFKGLQGLPEDMKPITKWENRDEAWTNVIDGIAKTVADIQADKSAIEQTNKEGLIQEVRERKLGEPSEVPRTLGENAPSFWGRYKIPIEIIVVILLLGIYFVPKWLQGDTKPESISHEKETKTTPTSPKLETTQAANDFEPMIQVQGGTFQMGSKRQDNEKPIHSVTLSTYYIGRTEVTQKQWHDIMGTNPSSVKNCDKCPVEQVSYEDIQTFLHKLNTKYPHKNYRLPTEAEWEFAAKGGNKSKAHTYAGSNNIKDVAWISENSGQKTHPVGQKSPNELGLYDMTGNVWEWCSDWFGNYNGSPQINPKGASSGTNRVGRGGGWNDGSERCTVSYRGDGVPSYKDEYLGFRLARTE